MAAVAAKAALILAACVLLLFAHSLPRAEALTVPTIPFPGQGYLPEGTHLSIALNIHLERIIGIGEREQNWRALHWFHLEWPDARAEQALLEATQLWANDVATGVSPQASSACSFACDSSGHLEAGCCDRLWLPQIELPNMLDYVTQDHPPRWRIWVQNGTVNWSVRMDATWFSPYDFRAWPLEHQHLLMEIQPANSIASKVALVFADTHNVVATPHTKGEDLPGWFIKKVTKRAFNTSSCYTQADSSSTIIKIDNVTGLVGMATVGPQDWFYSINSTAVIVTQVQAENCQGMLTGNINAAAQYAPIVLVMDHMVYRQRTYYALIFVVPVILVDLVCFTVYALERYNLEGRLTVIVTLLLAMCALQFTYDFPPAGYLNVIQQITAMSFLLMLLIALECMGVAQIALLHERRRRVAAFQEYIKSCRFGDDVQSKRDDVAVEMNPLNHTSSMNQAERSGLSKAHPGFPKHPSFHHSARASFHDGTANGGQAGKPQNPFLQSQNPGKRMIGPAAFGSVVSEALAHRSRAPTLDNKHRLSDVEEAGGVEGHTPRVGSQPLLPRAVTFDPEPHHMHSSPPAADSTSVPSDAPSGLTARHPHRLDQNNKSLSLPTSINASANEMPAQAAVLPPRMVSDEGYKASVLGTCSEIPMEGDEEDLRGRMIHHRVYCDPEEDKPPPPTNKKTGGRWSLLRRAAANMRPKSGWDSIKTTQIRQLMLQAQFQAERQVYRISRDEAYAQLVARKIDIICCWFFFFSFVVIVIVILVLGAAVGDHKLMLSGQTRPANA